MMPAEFSDAAAEGILRSGFTLIEMTETLQEAVRSTFLAAQVFFQESLDEKLRNRLPLDSGYRPPGQEYSESADHPDEVESFTISHRSTMGALHSDSARALAKKMVNVFDAFESIVEACAKRLAVRIQGDIRSQDFAGAFRQWSILQLNYSRPSSVRSQFINDFHEDGCLLTVSAVTGPGFELKSPDERFISLTPGMNELLVIPGEILWLLSGGLVSPAYHRVRPIPDLKERMSLLFFADMHPDRCTPWRESDINRGVDVGARVLTNSTRYGLEEWRLDERPPE